MGEPQPVGTGNGRSAAVRRRRGALSWLSPYLLLSIVVLLGSMVLAVRQPWGVDFGIHAAVVARLRDDLSQPGNPMVEAVGSNPYFTPYPVLLGLVARLTGWSAATVLSIAAPVNLALLLYGLRKFVGALTASRWAPVLALLFVSLLWGPAAPKWSGFPALAGLPLILPYPSTLALGLVLLCWFLIVWALAEPEVSTGRWWQMSTRSVGGRWVLVGLLGGLIVLIHPFTAICGAIGAVALVLGKLRGLGRTGWAGLLAAVGVLTVVVLGWPYFRVTDLLLSTAGLDTIHQPLYTDPVRWYGLGFLAGLPALVLRLCRDRFDPLTLLFGISGAVVLVGGVTDAYALGRVWPMVLLSLQLAAAVELARLGARFGMRLDRWGPARLATMLWMVVTIVACLAGLRAQYGNLLLVLPEDQLTPARRAAHDITRPADYSWVGRAVEPGTVLITGDRVIGRRLLAYEIRSVAPPWPDPLLPDEAQRRADQAEMLAEGTPEPRRGELLTRYGVDWILDCRGEYSWADQYAVAVVDGPGQARLLRLR